MAISYVGVKKNSTEHVAEFWSGSPTLRQRKRAPQPISVGVAWYNAETWARVKKTATDPDRFESTFGDWLAMAEDVLRDIAQAGVAPEKVLIDPEEFVTWCKTHRKRNNASSRATFVSRKLRSIDKRDA